MDEKDFALRLAKLRTKKGVSAREMSLAMGQNPGYVNNIESGKSMPSLPGILLICEYLGITPGEFFEEDNPCPERIRNLVTDLKQLDDAQLTLVEGLIKNLIR